MADRPLVLVDLLPDLCLPPCHTDFNAIRAESSPPPEPHSSFNWIAASVALTVHHVSLVPLPE